VTSETVRVAALRDRIAWDQLSPSRQRAIRDGLIVAGLIFNATLLIFWLPHLYLWIDAPSWYTIDLADIYGRARISLLEVGAFRLAPVFAWLMYPLGRLPYEVFIGLYLAFSLAAVSILVGRWTPMFILAFPPILLEGLNGNIHLFMALAIWAGLRWPSAWSFLLLTKVTPGVGVLWFAARREWRNLAIAIGATAAIVTLGFVIAPNQWLDWLGFLVTASTLPQVGTLPSLAVRLPLSALLVWYAARTDRAWLVPFACVLAMPTIWIQSSALLLACFPLYWQRARWQRTNTDGAATSASAEIGPTATEASA
jgi:hypothetical protein